MLYKQKVTFQPTRMTCNTTTVLSLTTLPLSSRLHWPLLRYCSLDRTWTIKQSKYRIGELCMIKIYCSSSDVQNVQWYSSFIDNGYGGIPALDILYFPIKFQGHSVFQGGSGGSIVVSHHIGDGTSCTKWFIGCKLQNWLYTHRKRIYKYTYLMCNACMYITYVWIYIYLGV